MLRYVRPSVRVLAPALVLALFLAACGGAPEPAQTAGNALSAPATATTGATATPAASPTPAPTDTPAPSPTPPATSTPAVELGDEQEAKEGGFAYRAVEDWELTPFGPLAVMMPGDADEDLGPLIVLMGGDAQALSITSTEALETPAALFAALMQSINPEVESAPEVTDLQDISIDGVDGQIGSIAFVEEGQELQGRLAVAVADSTRLFVILAASTPERWQETLPAFESVLASVRLFEPEPGSTTAPESTSVP